VKEDNARQPGAAAIILEDPANRDRGGDQQRNGQVDFDALSRERLEKMTAAGNEVLECHRVLAKSDSNVVAEVLPTDETFYEYDHCPAGDVYDKESHSQYYYHSHREGEHGHFHTFQREWGMPPGVQPIPQSETDGMREHGDKLSHLVAISMDQAGFPIGLFTTNRWVTAEYWYPEADVAAMLDSFIIDYTWPSWPTNRWVSAMLQLFHPQIVILLRQRDAKVACWAEQHPDEEVLEDRALDLTSYIGISIDTQIEQIQAALDERR
jgi:hypothetical protein